MTSVLVAALLVFGVYVASQRLSGVQLLISASLVFAGIALVVFPNLATAAARSLDVGRGTDLITYVAIVGGLFVAANFYFRFKRQERAMVTVVRALALRDAELHDRV